VTVVTHTLIVKRELVKAIELAETKTHLAERPA
jgi:hypothetical protein